MINTRSESLERTAASGLGALSALRHAEQLLQTPDLDTVNFAVLDAWVARVSYYLQEGGLASTQLSPELLKQVESYQSAHHMIQDGVTESELQGVETVGPTVQREGVSNLLSWRRAAIAEKFWKVMDKLPIPTGADTPSPRPVPVTVDQDQ